MDWFFDGLSAALWQIAAFAGLLILAAAGMWSCEYLGISPGFGIIAFYLSLILSLNLFFAWKNRDTLETLKAESKQ